MRPNRQASPKVAREQRADNDQCAMPASSSGRCMPHSREPDRVVQPPIVDGERNAEVRVSRDA